MPSVINKHRFVGVKYQVSNRLYKYKPGITGQTPCKWEEPKDQYQSTTGYGSTTYGYCDKSKPHLRLLEQGVLPHTRCLCDCCPFPAELRSLLLVSGWVCASAFKKGVGQLLETVQKGGGSSYLSIENRTEMERLKMYSMSKTEN